MYEDSHLEQAYEDAQDGGIDVDVEPYEHPDDLTCLEDDGDDTCEGDVEYRTPMSGTGRSFPRCDKHFAARWERQVEINERYPQFAPRDFDPSFAGESWDED